MSKFLLSGYWPIIFVFECNKYSTQLILKFRKDSRIEYTLLGPPFLPIYVSVTIKFKSVWKLPKTKKKSGKMISGVQLE